MLLKFFFHSRYRIHENQAALDIRQTGTVKWAHVLNRATIPPVFAGSYNHLVCEIANQRKSKDIIITNYHAEASQIGRNVNYGIIYIEQIPPRISLPRLNKFLSWSFGIYLNKQDQIGQIVKILNQYRCHQILVWSILGLVKRLKEHSPKLHIAFAQRRFDFTQESQLYEYCDSVIFQCPSQVKWALNNNPFFKPRYSIIPNGVELDRFKPLSPSQKIKLKLRFKIPTDKFIAIFPSRLTPEKGILFLAEWINHFKKEKPQVHFLLPGKINLNSISDIDSKKRIANIIKKNSNVTYLNGVPQKKMNLLFQCADICLMSGTVREGFSMASIEAMATGVPLIAVNEGCYQDIVKNDFNGLKYSLDNSINGPIQAILTLLHSKELLVKLSENSRNYAVNKLSRKKVIQNFDFFLQTQYSNIDSNLDFEVPFHE